MYGTNAYCKTVRHCSRTLIGKMSIILKHADYQSNKMPYLRVSSFLFTILLCNNNPCDQTRRLQVVPKEKLMRNLLSVAPPIKSKVMHSWSFGIAYYSYAIALSHTMDTWDPKKNTILVITKARDNKLVVFTRQLAEWLIFTPQYGKKNPFIV